jgi:hypothetical protein
VDIGFSKIESRRRIGFNVEVGRIMAIVLFATSPRIVLFATKSKKRRSTSFTTSVVLPCGFGKRHYLGVRVMDQ